MKQKGLTLMELLTVMSILATLSALLYPIYLKIRSRMYEIRCANQLRQIGLAIRMYAEDQGEGSPYSMPFVLGSLYPHYITDRDLLICPRVQVSLPDRFLKELRQLKVLKHYPWSSYENVYPKALDIIAKDHPGEHVSFAEVFAKRGEMTPIAWCEFHRYCNPLVLAVIRAPEYLAWVTHCDDIFLTPNGPLVILRWGGMVDFVNKGPYAPFHGDVFLLDY